MAEPWLDRREIGPCVLYLGDCLALLEAGEIPPGAAIVSDPPYGIDFQRGVGGASGWAAANMVKQKAGTASKCQSDDTPFDPTPWLGHAEQTANRAGGARRLGGGRIALLGAEHFAWALPRLGAFYCWDKSCGGGPADSYADAEFIWMSARNARRIYRHQWKGRLRQGDSGARLHVMQKPVPLMAWMIETVRTPVGSLVCDPYMGSGTTGIACIQTGRRFLGIEIDPAHYETACARIERAWAALNPEPRTPNPPP